MHKIKRLLTKFDPEVTEPKFIVMSSQLYSGFYVSAAGETIELRHSDKVTNVDLISYLDEEFGIKEEDLPVKQDGSMKVFDTETANISVTWHMSLTFMSEYLKVSISKKRQYKRIVLPKHIKFYTVDEMLDPKFDVVDYAMTVNKRCKVIELETPDSLFYTPVAYAVECAKRQNELSFLSICTALFEGKQPEDVGIRHFNNSPKNIQDTVLNLPSTGTIKAAAAFYILQHQFVLFPHDSLAEFK